MLLLVILTIKADDMKGLLLVSGDRRAVPAVRKRRDWTKIGPCTVPDEERSSAERQRNPGSGMVTGCGPGRPDANVDASSASQQTSILNNVNEEYEIGETAGEKAPEE